MSAINFTLGWAKPYATFIIIEKKTKEILLYIQVISISIRLGKITCNTYHNTENPKKIYFYTSNISYKSISIKLSETAYNTYHNRKTKKQKILYRVISDPTNLHHEL